MAPKRKTDILANENGSKKVCVGTAVLTLDDGVLECELKDRKPEGKGKMTFKNGDVLECDGWKDGKAYGKGKQTFSWGDVFECEWRDGVAVGKGKKTLANGYVFEGIFKDGEANGKGKETYANGDVFECTFKDGKANGEGVWTYTNGDKFVTEYKDDIPLSMGVKTYNNGDVLTCQKWKVTYDNDNPNGKGTLKLARSGYEIEGEWKDGKLQSGAFLKTSDGAIFSIKATSLMNIAGD